MTSWWDRDIVEPGKEALLLCLLAFMVTFLSTRTIVRLIRAGRGPFRNVSAGGMHIHHVVPGTILLITGGLLAIGAPPHAPWRDIAGVVVGVGAALVLDEFALILHLRDVYWQPAGRASVTAVLLTAGVMGCVLLGFSPLGVNDVHQQEWAVRMVGRPGAGGGGRRAAQGQVRDGAAGSLRPPARDRRQHPARPAELALGPLVLPP
ncbi:membrane hypothetical protein [Frankia canadensis]|uniref:Integral membrane protein n=1 Tax=Frankia canadensis TaxID=1836972 RepID=A0A2I2L064_9ACTN|nr:hypothetical protein [Frankia canadensis]SNQ51295.1 membrane hypothetical protein [Frankia canadensis]SOU58585.1 membrane hypothetical protein [Frankia canadensis]